MSAFTVSCNTWNFNSRKYERGVQIASNDEMSETTCLLAKGPEQANDTAVSAHPAENTIPTFSTASSSV